MHFSHSDSVERVDIRECQPAGLTRRLNRLGELDRSRRPSCRFEPRHSVRECALLCDLGDRPQRPDSCIVPALPRRKMAWRSLSDLSWPARADEQGERGVLAPNGESQGDRVLLRHPAAVCRSREPVAAQT